jgi:hypothetical protein
MWGQALLGSGLRPEAYMKINDFQHSHTPALQHSSTLLTEYPLTESHSCISLTLN